MQLTHNFSLEEFNSRDGVQVPPVYYLNVKTLADNLQVLRDELQKPIHINSGFRSVRHNKEVGGLKNSMHLVGKAADISVFGFSPAFVYDTISRLIEEHKMLEGGLGLYNGFVHYDIRGKKARWDLREHI